MAKVTINDIAIEAGVSRGTVDRVINNRPNVKPEIRQKVLQVIDELGFIPNKAARLLAFKTKNKKIAVLFPTSYGQHFGTEVMRGIEQARKENEDFGLDIIAEPCESGLPDEYLEKIDRLIENGVSAFAICARNTIAIQEKINELVRNNFPVITFNSDIPQSNRICFVGQNLVKSGRIAAQIMINCLNEEDQILIVTGNLEYDAHKRRVSGFCDRMTELGIGPERYSIVEGFQDYGLVFDRVSKAITSKDNLRGIYMATESVPACAEAIRRAQRPYKIKLICHDVSNATANLLNEGIVDFAIEQNIYLQGYKPIMMLRDILFMNQKQVNELEYTQINIVNSENLTP